MGAFQGGLTYRQYRVKERLPAQWQNRVLQGILGNLAKEIQPENDEVRNIGWCSAQFILDTQITLDQCLYNEYLIIAMRVDTLSVPK